MLCPSSRGDVTGWYVNVLPGQCCIRNGKKRWMICCSWHLGSSWKGLGRLFHCTEVCLPTATCLPSWQMPVNKDAEATCRLFPFSRNPRQRVILRKHLSAQYTSWNGYLDCDHISCGIMPQLFLSVLRGKKPRVTNHISSSIVAVATKSTLGQILFRVKNSPSAKSLYNWKSQRDILKMVFWSP